MSVQTYTLADFMVGGRVILCPSCGAEMDVRVGIDGSRNVLALTCPNSHVRKFDWPIGSQPPTEAVVMLEGGRAG